MSEPHSGHEPNTLHDTDNVRPASARNRRPPPQTRRAHHHAHQRARLQRDDWRRKAVALGFVVPVLLIMLHHAATLHP